MAGMNNTDQFSTLSVTSMLLEYMQNVICSGLTVLSKTFPVRKTQKNNQKPKQNWMAIHVS